MSKLSAWLRPFQLTINRSEGPLTVLVPTWAREVPFLANADSARFVLIMECCPSPAVRLQRTSGIQDDLGLLFGETEKFTRTVVMCNCKQVMVAHGFLTNNIDKWQIPCQAELPKNWATTPDSWQLPTDEQVIKLLQREKARGNYENWLKAVAHRVPLAGLFSGIIDHPNEAFNDTKQSDLRKEDHKFNLHSDKEQRRPSLFKQELRF